MALGGSYASKQSVIIGAVLFVFIWYLGFNSQAVPARSSVVSQMSRVPPALGQASTCPPHVRHRD